MTNSYIPEAVFPSLCAHVRFFDAHDFFYSQLHAIFGPFYSRFSVNVAVLYAGYLCVHPISLPINHFDFFFKRWQTELFAFLFSFDSDRPVLRYWPPNLYVCSASQARNSENSWIQNHNSYIPEAHPGACRAFKNGSTGYRGGPFQSLLWGTVLETWLTCWSKSSS